VLPYSTCRIAPMWLLLSLSAVACGPQEGRPVADVVLIGGRIWTAPGAAVSGNDAAGALAVSNGRVLAVGSDDEIERHIGPATARIDLAGRRVVPGFMDAHTHFISGGLELAGIALRDAATPEEFIRRIDRFAADREGEWVLGGSWDHELWGGQLPRRDWIDSVTPGTPVFVTRLDGHMSLANSKALELAGVTAETPDPSGGAIVRYGDGRPTGVLKDAAQELVSRVIPDPSEAELDRALQAAAQHAVARGVTSITDMGTWEGLATYRRAKNRGELPLRVYAVVPMATRERLAEFVRDNGAGDDRLFWGGLKAFVDGSLGSTTAWFYEPYVDEPGTSGLMVTDTAELREAIVESDRQGFQVIVHAIGDRANDWLLDVYAAARELNGSRDRRARIEHAQHLSRAAIGRFGPEGVIPSMQPYHAIDDGRWAAKRIGPERIATTYAFKDLLQAGARVAFGSDWTVAPIDPLLGIYAAVTRRTTDGANPDGWVPAQKISVEQALAAYTAANAYACFREDRVGTLEVGKYADLAVLSDDILSIDPVAIEQVRVDLTMVEGEVVYER
jgi:predicted amidohydrolase YtcJ